MVTVKVRHKGAVSELQATDLLAASLAAEYARLGGCPLCDQFPADGHLLACPLVQDVIASGSMPRTLEIGGRLVWSEA